jgi:hypothetical protein
MKAIIRHRVRAGWERRFRNHRRIGGDSCDVVVPEELRSITRKPALMAGFAY